MTIFKKSRDLEFFLTEFCKKRSKLGFVPTMGALHPGHVSLISESKKYDDLTVCSIFINPVQFNDPADFEKYPVTIEKDILMLENAGCDILFLPSVKEIYPAGPIQDKHYELGYLETILEGQYRPGHFQAVCMVIDKLLKIVNPGTLYLGRKDFQQCLVIKKLIEDLGLSETITLKICNTYREPDGLAMSSRNLRLNETERKKATGIYKALEFLKANIKKGDLAGIEQQASRLLAEHGFKSDYVEVADAKNLRLLSDWDGHTPVVGLIAAYMNNVRLIDNIALS